MLISQLKYLEAEENGFSMFVRYFPLTIEPPLTLENGYSAELGPILENIFGLLRHQRADRKSIILTSAHLQNLADVSRI